MSVMSPFMHIHLTAGAKIHSKIFKVMERILYIQLIGIIMLRVSFAQTNETISMQGLTDASESRIAESDSNPTEKENVGYWISLGVGKSYFGPTLGGSLSYAFKENVFTLRYFKGDELQFNPGGSDYDEPALNFRELGLLYGRLFRKEALVFTLSGGIGFLDGTDRGNEITPKEFENIHISTVGLAFESEFRIELSGYIGVGGSFWGGVNSKKTFTGGMLKIHFGKLR